MADLNISDAIRTDGGMMGYKPKICHTCKTAIYEGQTIKKAKLEIFCSDDCKQEFMDIQRVQSYRRQLSDRKSLGYNYPKRDRTEYYREYRKKNIEKKKESARKAMVKYRLKKKVELLKTNIDKQNDNSTRINTTLAEI